MKKFFYAAVVSFIMVPFFLAAQEGKRESANLNELGKLYDKQIYELNLDIQKLIADGKFMENREFRSLPYQSEINYGPDTKNPQYVELKKHIYTRNGELGAEVVGYEEKTMQMYTDGKTISKIVTIVSKKNFRTLEEEIVTMIDPSPTTEGTDDIVLTHQYNKRILVKEKKLAEIENTMDGPVRNSIKIQFIIPNLAILNNMLVFISEVNSKDSKDADRKMTEFLNKAALY